MATRPPRQILPCRLGRGNGAASIRQCTSSDACLSLLPDIRPSIGFIALTSCKGPQSHYYAMCLRGMARMELPPNHCIRYNTVKGSVVPQSRIEVPANL